MSGDVRFCLCCGTPIKLTKAWRYLCRECDLPQHEGRFCPVHPTADQVTAWRDGLASPPLRGGQITPHHPPEWARYIREWRVVGTTVLDQYTDAYMAHHPVFGMAWGGEDPDYDLNWAYMSGVVQALLPIETHRALILTEDGFDWLYGDVVLQPQNSRSCRGFLLTGPDTIPDQRQREGDLVIPYGPLLFSRLITACQLLVYGRDDDEA